MNLAESYLCVNCEEIHDDIVCPKCFSKSNLSLRKILNRGPAPKKIGKDRYDKG